MSRLTRDGTAEPVSQNQILRRERGQGNIHFPCSVDHVQDWQPYPVEIYTLANKCVTIHGNYFRVLSIVLDSRQFCISFFAILAGTT